MIKRLSALIFILAIAGQVWAATCVCEDAEPVHKCCLRLAEQSDYASSRGCCGPENCEAAPAPTPAVRICQVNIAVADQAALLPFHPSFVRDQAVIEKTIPKVIMRGRYRPYARPPDLYVRHHAFLI
jgi:hypothetical protein